VAKKTDRKKNVPARKPAKGSKAAKPAAASKRGGKSAAKATTKSKTKRAPAKAAGKPKAASKKKTAKKAAKPARKPVTKPKAKSTAGKARAAVVPKPRSKAAAKSRKAKTTAAKTKAKPKASKAPKIAAPKSKGARKVVAPKPERRKPTPKKAPRAPKASAQPIESPAPPAPAESRSRSRSRAKAKAAAPPAPPTPTPTAVRPATKPGRKPLRITAAAPVVAAPQAVAGPPVDLVAVRERLVNKKKEIVALYLSDLRSGQESNDSPTEDIVDRANNAYSRELNFSISDAERALLLQVDEAIVRVDKGQYGLCANCGQPIARPRLDALPWARYCIVCQELLEQGMLAEG